MRTAQIVELDLVQERPAQRGYASVTLALMGYVWRVLRNRWVANRLHDLDDRQLDDIGLTRHDVMKATHGSGLFDDPSALLAESARRRALTRFQRLSRN
ncbi:uncharacterized protein YjiS (DUF1127 family) [Pseudorhizobium tarimense]|uniref:Uncharacterized protein YjiS (DUF1127 family) n=1 Tax=Pseudorhizobium tarimense TaxID=1079109 RepID=A0ABV2H1B1_9HYPH|nr:DUF1127 domain-containing protein [Pseudorhizobium tarimense]MCJ8517648.1 DUF1127 domain-containing protein [Pseudorhizobium tarimense]